jgi:hypothetical protein
LVEELVDNVLHEFLDGFDVIPTRIDEPCFRRVGTMHICPLCFQ